MSRRAENACDWYRILRVKPTATQAEITAAYYALARNHHPDTASDRDPSNRRFKDIAEAYSVLSDPGKRRQYDQLVKTNRPPSRTHSPYANAQCQEDLDIHASLPITPEESRCGAVCELRITHQTRCEGCRNNGLPGSHGCEQCDFSGRTAVSETIQVQLPRGVRAGTVLVIHHHGHESSTQDTTGKRGSLFLRVVIRPCW
jgi:DnaJ-class molecular chaperone